MKKIKVVSVSLLALMVVAISAFALVGCGGNTAQSVEGTWEYTKFEIGGSDMMGLAQAVGGSMKLELKDGKATIVSEVSGDKSEETAGEYKVDGNKIKLGIGTASEMEGTVSGNKMTFDVTKDGVQVVWELEKK